MTENWRIKGYLTCSVGGETLGHAFGNWLKFKNIIIPKINGSGTFTGDGVMEVLNLETISFLPGMNSLKNEVSRDELTIDDLISHIEKHNYSKDDIIRELKNLKARIKDLPDYHKLNLKSF